MRPTQDLHVVRTEPLISPAELLADLPMTATANRTVVAGREQVQRILAGEDSRLLACVGPCSIHDVKGAVEYAQRLLRLSLDVKDRICLVMRVYFEKPRTTVGWKGLINDPHLNDTFDISTGLRMARELLLQINEMGMPAATEMLEPITPQYIDDLITLSSIGARTTESPTHRQMASGLSMPVGYKNSTDGNLQVALDAMTAARHSHRFLGIDRAGHTCVIETNGNPWGFMILRGGRSGTNYSEKHLRDAAKRLTAADLPPRVVVDCSHANSEKDHTRQAVVWRDVVRQRVAGNDAICGLMLESNLEAGKQNLTSDLSQLRYGVSITDGCIDWAESEALIREAHQLLG